ncbi:MAG: ABC transporter permease subunit [Planctomycetota bacterium]
MAVDEYRLLGWAYFRSGELQLFRLDDGTVLERRKLFPEPPTAWSFDLEGETALFGFRDGSVRFARIGFTTTYVEPEQLPDAVRALSPGQIARHDGGLIQLTPKGQFRLQNLDAKARDPIATSTTAAVIRLDHMESASGRAFCALSADGKLTLNRLRERRNILTGETTERVVTAEIPREPGAGRGAPDGLFLSGVGDTLYLVWNDGHLVRFDLRDPERTQVAEHVALLPRGGGSATRVGFLLGKATLLVGDSSGGLRAWFPIRPERAGTPDGSVLVEGHSLEGRASPVTALGMSSRTRLVAAGYGDGAIRLFNVTSERLVGEVRGTPGSPVAALAIAPKENGLVAWQGGRIHVWDVDVRHPEAGMKSLFTKVWYEGYPEPSHDWQSSGGTDDFEPKFGMVQLIFGTLKATLYSMLFGVPLALLAAIYTSEFVAPRVRAPVKSVIEMMASLPSVVLGFIAALIVAPFVQDKVPTALAVFFTVPLALLLGARLWQLLPPALALRLAGWPRFAGILLTLPIGVAVALLLGPAIEKALFEGRFLDWLDGQIGGAAGGWALLLFPLSCLATALLFGRFATPWLRSVSLSWSRTACARADLAKFVAAVGVAAAMSFALGLFLDLAGADPRGGMLGPFGTYVQRNSLIVGFLMGFAIIPIIYTLAEDALSSVPDHLRLGSLGAGATPWQTAVRIVVPTAMSGLFSAVMIGLGRAVGETMIVLMATGNTPVMKLNIFSGFRTLSANIAVELPEAPRDGTHYRTLFLAALVLFAITFLLNSLAEAVRQRFRRRAYQL